MKSNKTSRKRFEDVRNNEITFSFISQKLNANKEEEERQKKNNRFCVPLIDETYGDQWEEIFLAEKTYCSFVVIRSESGGKYFRILMK